MWSKQTGERLLDLQFPIEIARGFKVIQSKDWDLKTRYSQFQMRSARCTPLGNANGNTVFVAAYNSISRGSKDQACYLSLWTFNSQRKVARPIVTKLIAKNQVSLTKNTGHLLLEYFFSDLSRSGPGRAEIKYIFGPF